MISTLKKELGEKLSPIFQRTPQEIESLFEAPKQQGHGHLALPVFAFAKELRKAPPIIANEFKEKALALSIPNIEKIDAVSGFVNFTFNSQYVQSLVFAETLGPIEKLGRSSRFNGKLMTIDYSSPNVAKPMSIGHLRATVIGQAIVNLAKSQGYNVLGINYLGDWGVQFGKLAWAYENWGKDYSFDERPIDSLFQLYVRFHEEAETNPELEEKGAQYFRRLEKGDPDIQKIWKFFIDLSLKDYERLWGMLGVRHELVRGESYYNDKLDDVVKMLKAKGLLEESEGALVVRLDDLNMPPCLIQKKDGASLYATRDLASAIDRIENLKSDLNVYVVGMDQTLHFRQVFEVLKRAGFEWAERCHHVSFGMYRFKDQRMSTRKGNVIFLEDVVSKAIQGVREQIEIKNPNLEDKETVSRQVGVGAVIFNDLMNDRQKNVDFDWERVLDFNGDSGPYVQYTAVRCQSLIAKYQGDASAPTNVVLDTPEEMEVLRALMLYPETLQKAFDGFKPHVLAGYLLDLCKLFNIYYAKHKILIGDDDHVRARLKLVRSILATLKSGLGVLGIEVPKAM